MQLNGLTVTGCDGTNVNTRHKGGIIRLMEPDLNRPLQWCICFFHTNELPLHHLLNCLDGSTSGPTEICRPIGKAFKSCEDLPVAPFSSISLENMPDRMVLSNDQQYIYDIFLAISRVECYYDLALRKPVPVANSSWLTTSGRILRLYVATENHLRILLFLQNILGRYMHLYGSLSRQSPP
ncbi:hypothetical protein AVEN_209305-1 [Araneus ventricosus]|uniref:Uncharacterized protein n=1 Tax=Araneus ventricosus TaxID=182803 RepID=A0A4Y2CAY1_ARAVE|nr:hypothetical protein AVEN_209305-1 [Araneus ventricosus]